MIHDLLESRHFVKFLYVQSDKKKSWGKNKIC